MKYILGSVDHFAALIATALMAARRGTVTGLGSVTDKGSWMEEAQRSLDAHRAWDTAHDAPEDDPQPPQVWPKQCPTCARVHNAAAWECLEFKGYVGVFRAHGVRYAVQLRQCICTSTIGIEVALPMAKEVPVHDAGLHGFLVRVGQRPDETEEEHTKRCPLPFRHTAACEEWPF